MHYLLHRFSKRGPNMREEHITNTGIAVEHVRVQVLPDGRMTPKNAALYLGNEEGTLSNWRYLGQGPKWRRVGGRIFYYQDDLEQYIAGSLTG